MRIVLVVEYDGKNYAGWQSQKDENTVQSVLEEAIYSLTGERSRVIGSGRTDAGVSALGQVAHFDTHTTIPPERIFLGLNILLPADVKVLKSYQAAEGFHARFTAKRKTYAYSYYVSRVYRPLKEPHAVRINAVNADKMNEAAKRFVGTKDFKCYLATNSTVKDTVRTVYSAEVTRLGDDITFEICGNGFLYNMVRIMAGTLLLVGEGKLEPSDVDALIEKGERTGVGKTMEAKALMLKSVEYE